MIKYIIIGLFLFTSLFAKEWTVMIFINGDNNLDSFAFDDVNELELVGSSEDINILVQYDRFVANPRANWSTAKRFYIEKDDDVETISSTELMDLGEVDSGDYNSVIDFVTWAKANYESQKYALIIWDHGSGWQKKSIINTGYTKSISSDDTSGNHISVANGDFSLMLSSIKQVLGKKIDLLGLDACLMAMWEVAYSSEQYADYMAFSEETENGTGWEYTNLLNEFNLTDKSAKNLCKSIVSSSIDSVGATLSCVDLSIIPSFTEKINNFATNFKTDNSIDLEILTAFSFALGMEEEAYYKDIGMFFTRLSELVSIDIKNLWISPILSDYTNLVVSSEGKDAPFTDYSVSTGLTIFMPLNASYDNTSEYNNASWSANTNWNEFVSRTFILSEDEYEDDNSIETAYFNESLEETYHTIHNNSDNDFMKISTENGYFYTFEALCDEYDTFMTIFNEDGNIITEDDDGGNKRCSKTSYFAQNNAFIYIKTNTYDNSEIAVYKLKITKTERLDDYPNSIEFIKTEDLLSTDLIGNIEYEEDIDFLYLDVISTKEYTIETIEDTLDDTILTVYNSNGEFITENDDVNTSGKNYMSKVSFTPLKNERYYISIKAYENKTGTYKMNIQTLNNCENTNDGIEICDGIDNDCDGEVDNNLEIPNTDNQNGICQSAKKVCDGINGWIEDYSLIEKYEETEITCDGLDNDCDGNIDNNLDAPNNINQKGVCENSKQICDGANGWKENYENIKNYTLSDDNNDDLDNNCDGQIDESYTSTSSCTFSNKNSVLELMFFMLLVFSFFRFSNLILKREN